MSEWKRKDGRITCTILWLILFLAPFTIHQRSRSKMEINRIWRFLPTDVFFPAISGQIVPAATILFKISQIQKPFFKLCAAQWFHHPRICWSLSELVCFSVHLSLSAALRKSERCLSVLTPFSTSTSHIAMQKMLISDGLIEASEGS